MDPEENSVRSFVVQELLHTERRYVARLETFVEVFVKPLRAAGKLPEPVDDAFEAIEALVPLQVRGCRCWFVDTPPGGSLGILYMTWCLQTQLLEELGVARKTKASIGAVFIKFQGFLKQL